MRFDSDIGILNFSDAIDTFNKLQLEYRTLVFNKQKTYIDGLEQRTRNLCRFF